MKLLYFILTLSLSAIAHPKCDTELQKHERVSKIEAPQFSQTQFAKTLKSLQISYVLTFPPLLDKVIKKLPDSQIKSFLQNNNQVKHLQPIDRYGLTHQQVYKKLIDDLKEFPSLTTKKSQKIQKMLINRPGVIRNSIDYAFFIDYLYYTDRYSDHLKRLEKFFDLYPLYKTNNLPPSKLATFKKIEKINSKSIEFYKARKAHHKDEHKALSETREYKRLKFMCHAKTLSKPVKVSKKTFKGFAYASAAFFLTLGYISENNFEKTDGEKKYLIELIQTLAATYLFNRQVLKVTGSFVQKFSTLLLYNLGFNSVDSVAYYIGFEQKISKDDLQILTTRVAKEIQQRVEKYEDLTSLIQLIDRYELHSPEIQEELAKLSKVEHSEEQLNEFIIEELAKNLIYLEKHQGNAKWLKTGSETLDRFLYNNSYSILSTVKSLYLGLQLSKLLCEGWRIGPHFIGGKGNLAQSIAVMTGVAIIDKFTFNTLYYGGRDWMIKQ